MVTITCWCAYKTIQIDPVARGPTAAPGHYEFCRGGQQEKWWDGDILYRADLFELEEDSVMDWGSNRGAAGIGLEQMWSTVICNR